MSTATIILQDVVEKLPDDSTLILQDISWEEYEELLDSIGESRGVRISYDEGTLQILTLSSKHEKYAKLIERMIDRVSMRRGVKILFYGSATMKKQRRLKGAEPDGCFYIQHADQVGSKEDIDFSSDPPPDIIVEIDIHHESLSKFSIYAALGVPEIWRYNEQSLIIYHLVNDEYIEAPLSLALPMLASSTLSGFLARGQHEDQHEILIDFERWLQN